MNKNRRNTIFSIIAAAILIMSVEYLSCYLSENIENSIFAIKILICFMITIITVVAVLFGPINGIIISAIEIILSLVIKAVFNYFDNIIYYISNINWIITNSFHILYGAAIGMFWKIYKNNTITIRLKQIIVYSSVQLVFYILFYQAVFKYYIMDIFSIITDKETLKDYLIIAVMDIVFIIVYVKIKNKRGFNEARTVEVPHTTRTNFRRNVS